jgi:hypothetical protein
MSEQAPDPRPEPNQRLVLGALLALMFLLGCVPMSDFDVWSHLRTGQLILERREIPRIDLFTYTNMDRLWINLYWFFQVVLSLLYRAGGVTTLVLFKAVCGVGVVALSLAARRNDTRAWPAVLAWLPGVVLLSGRLSERPELFSLLCLGGFLAVLAHAGERPWLLWLLPAIQIVWVNSHGFFVLGPLVLAAYVAEWVHDRLRPPTTTVPRPTGKLLALAGAAVLLACVASPYGPGVLRLPIEQFGKLGSSGIYRANISELRTVTDFIRLGALGNPYLLANFALVLLGAASFIVLGRCGRLPIFRILLYLGGTYTGWQATRNSSLLALLVGTVVCWNFDDWLGRRKAPATRSSSKRSRSRAVTPPRRLYPNTVPLVAIAGLAVATLSGGLYAWGGEGRTIGLGERKDWFAHEACEFLNRPNLPERIVAFNLGQAAVCIAHTAPGRRQFMDPRLEVNRQETFERYLQAMRKLLYDQPGWELALGINYARPDELPAIVLERALLGKAAENLHRDPRWRLVHIDPVAVVFVATAVAEARGLAPAKP